MSENVQIYVISHKEIEDISSDDLYTPLFVGSTGKETPTDNQNNKYQRDDSGANISNRNPIMQNLLDYIGCGKILQRIFWD